MAEWCGVENSARETKRRRGAQERTEGERGVFDRRRKRAKGKGERELPGRNKLARNERQIASELSARSPDVIEAAMLLPPPPPFLLLLRGRLRLRVSLCFLPSVSLTFSYSRVRPIVILSLSFSRSTPSPVVDRSPRGEKRDRGSSSGFLSFPLSLLHRYFAFLPRPLPSALRTAGHLDGRLSIHQGPTSPLPIDRLCPRRENSRSVDLPSPDTRLAGVPFRRSRRLTVSPIPQVFFIVLARRMIFFKVPASAKSITQRSASARVITPHSLLS